MKTANFERSRIIETYGRFPFATDRDDWLISIANKDEYNARPKAYFEKVLYLNFQDVEQDNCGGITLAQAEQIAEFIKEARVLQKNVWVNCHAGMCRSGAIVRVLLELGWEENKYRGQPFRQPNLFVYNRVRAHFPELKQSWEDHET